MAKRTNLQLLNVVLGGCNQADVSALSSLTGMQVTCWNYLLEAMRELWVMRDWKFLETKGTMTLTSGLSSYAHATDMLNEDVDSFRQEDDEKNLTYKEPDQFDLLYPVVEDTGMPSEFTSINGYWYFNHVPTSSEAGSKICYRYWKRGTVFTTSATTQTSELPEDWEEIVLCKLAIFKSLAFIGDQGAQTIYVELYGDGNKNEGNINRMKRYQSSPPLDKVRVNIIL